MRHFFRLQLLGFMVAVALVIVFLSWTQRISWRQLETMRREYDAVQFDSFHFAERIKGTVLELNETLVRFDVRENPEDPVKFRAASQALAQWMRDGLDELNTAAEREAMAQIQAAFPAYLASAQAIMAESARSPGFDVPAVLQNSEAPSRRLLQLCDQLAAAHRTALTGYLADAHAGIVRLQRLLTVRLLISLGLVVALAAYVYRGAITPLRDRLKASQVIIERQEKLSALGVLAAGVAHEIRNPLTAVNVRLHSLQRAIKGNPSATEDLNVIHVEINRLERILKDFLQFARPSEPQLVPLAADLLLRELEVLLKPELAKSRIALKLAPACSVPIRIDRQQMKQVLINLIRNAAESLGEAGTITLATRLGTMPRQRRSLPAVVLEVQDTGPGIPRDVRQRLFDPFFTTKEGGTGLGLTIAARIVEKHRGILQFETAPGQGTTFRILLPRGDGDET